MRVLIKILLVLVASAAVTAFAGRALTGRFPSVWTVTGGAIAGTLAVLLADVLVGW